MKGKINSAIFFNIKQNGHNIVNNLGVDRRERLIMTASGKAS